MALPKPMKERKFPHLCCGYGPFINNGPNGHVRACNAEVGGCGAIMIGNDDTLREQFAWHDEHCFRVIPESVIAEPVVLTIVPKPESEPELESESIPDPVMPESPEVETHNRRWQWGTKKQCQDKCEEFFSQGIVMEVYRERANPRNKQYGYRRTD